MRTKTNQTKPDETRHVGNMFLLSDAQLVACDLWLAGSTDQEVAAAVHRTRQTVCDWRNRHPAVRAELNRRRQELRHATMDRLRSLVPKALERLERELEAGPEGGRLAVALLGKLDIASWDLEAHGPTTVEEVIDAEALSRRPFDLFSIATGTPKPVTEEERQTVIEELEELAVDQNPAGGDSSPRYLASASPPDFPDV